MLPRGRPAESAEDTEEKENIWMHCSIFSPYFSAISVSSAPLRLCGFSPYFDGT